MTPAGIPISSYRVQFNKDFRFLDCRDIVPYLHLLGIGALYSSPRFQARRGSEHGYDVASALRINSELGSDEEFDDLCSKLRRYGMGLVLDIVPNHMAASKENPWWMDVLENGPASPYAHYFDIDWHPATSKAAFLQENRILLPVLGDLYGNVLEQGQLSLGLDETGFFLRYFERTLPLDPKSYGPVLGACLDHLARSPGPGDASIAEIDEARRLVSLIPARTVTDREDIERRFREGRAVKRRVFEVYRDHLESRQAIDAALRELSANADGMHQLLEDQAYRLAFWRIASEEINYRRFFDVNDLICVREEEEDVFTARHQIVFQLIAEGKVTGLRVDHIDGLYDPEGYLAKLQASASAAASGSSVYVAVEKILGRGEVLPPTWQISGTTGYDFLNVLNELFIEPDGLQEMVAVYSRFTGETEPFAEICYARNKQVMRMLFAGEVRALGHHLGGLAARDRQARDVPLSELKGALVEVTACLPVYRTYIRSFEIGARDRECLERTIDLARWRTPDRKIGTPAFDFLRRVLFLEPAPYAQDLKDEYLRFVMRWQQFTGPVMAKGLEDTAYYVHNSLISMNEVGGDPLRENPPRDLAAFHKFQKERLKAWPYSMSATATHDTKHGEDARARLNVLSEIPREWEKHLLRWAHLNQRHKTEVKGIPVPAPSEETMLYQTLLGSWPFDAEEEAEFQNRVREYLKKAVREAKVYSEWIRPNEAHESALYRFAQQIFSNGSGPFQDDFRRFQRKIAWHGALNSLSQVLIKITAPGVPDFYQGTELWDFSMVDPDNRRPVDFAKRVQMLEEIRKLPGESSTRLSREVLSKWKDGRIKLYLIDRALDFRRAHAEVYLEGDYTPLEAQGPGQPCLCAFARKKDGHWCVTVAPRLTTRLVATGRMPLGKAVWGTTVVQLPAAAPESWQNILTGERLKASRTADGRKALAVADVLSRFPVALLSTAE